LGNSGLEEAKRTLNAQQSPEVGAYDYAWATMVRKRKGNPNWGKSQALPSPVATEFETVALRLRLTKETYLDSTQLRRWCESNNHRCYVPEWLLKEWGILPDIGST
jgi:hypothetical protein